MSGCTGIEQKVKGYLKTRAASVQRDPCVQIAGSSVIQHDNVGGDFVMLERRFRLQWLARPALCLPGRARSRMSNTMEPKPSYRSLDRAETPPPSAFCIGARLDRVLKSPLLLVR